MSKSQKYTRRSTKDFYKILRVHQTATAKEIKTSYYQIAMQLHPDKHEGCSKKMAQFKEVNEAYTILSDAGKRAQYDFQFGLKYNRNRRTPPPPNYRKVYAPRPPPDWKYTWDHVKHQDMHYGDGQMNEALKQARKEAERSGAFEYKSPLGKGFTFEKDGETFNGHEYNPYSNRPQGPPRVVFEYEEGTMHVGGSKGRGGKDFFTRKERIVEDLHTRRRERHNNNNNKDGGTTTTNTPYNNQQQQRQQREYHERMYATTTSAAGAAGATANGAASPYAQFHAQAPFRNGNNSSRNPGECIIL